MKLNLHCKNVCFFKSANPSDSLYLKQTCSFCLILLLAHLPRDWNVAGWFPAATSSSFLKCFIWQLQLIENKGEMNWGYLGKNNDFYCFFLQPSAKEQGITRVVALVKFFLHFLIKRFWSGNNFSASKLWNGSSCSTAKSATTWPTET